MVILMRSAPVHHGERRLELGAGQVANGSDVGGSTLRRAFGRLVLRSDCVSNDVFDVLVVDAERGADVYGPDLGTNVGLEAELAANVGARGLLRVVGGRGASWATVLLQDVDRACNDEHDDDE